MKSDESEVAVIARPQTAETSSRGKRAAKSDAADPDIALRLRNIWKVFNPEIQRAFPPRPPAGIEPPPLTDSLLQVLHADGHVPAIAGVDLDVHKGEILVIMGLSGSGKSTLLRCMSRLIEPEWGSVHFHGQDLLSLSPKELVQIRRHKIGMVFQDFGLMPHMSVLENVAFGLKIQGVKRAEREKRGREVLELVGLAGRESAMPHELSGGQQQRVGIARSLAGEPELWFLDEPFSALDPLIRRQMQEELLSLQRLLNKTIVFITHDFAEAARIADRVAIMRNGEVVQVGRPADLILNPATDYVAEFTAEVSRGDALRVGDLMDETPPASDDGGPVSADTPLDALWNQVLRDHSATLPVVDDKGDVIGSISTDAIIDAYCKEKNRVDG
ncbi:ATP-binding cassette domain-containing protein [Methyloligella sp. 2.7D]|uniref:quaternary amine ABC transporter ATP-binding protein n=1 Tax=unclassified Methyloligella TaxID=2625955 RepID=UPI00157D238C|nr:ATP-binding cassette domain-containing protein [Methyloligella sp. GL2]QKP76955.1 ATP-binding cassette domain-containing protein [Methyloligella sp. GL2]